MRSHRGRPRGPWGAGGSRRATVRDGLAVVEHVDLLAHAHHDLHVVLDEHHREVEPFAKPADLLFQPLGLAVVHARRRLVEQQESSGRASSRGAISRRRWLPYESEVDRSSARRAELEDVEQLERLVAHLRPLRSRNAASGASAPRSPALALGFAGDEHVVEHGHLAEETDVLKGARDSGRRDSRPTVRVVRSTPFMRIDARCPAGRRR